jgi:hypothetical protein
VAKVRLAEGMGLALLAVLGVGLGSCLLPVRSGPGVDGRVVDRDSGEPVADAVVVVRWDGRYGQDLPDREQLGHAEAVTGPDGRFAVPSYTRGGLTVWPLFQTEARVVGVIHPGYRCPHPVKVDPSGSLEIRLAPSVVEAERRESCRPLRARRGEADRYLAAWRELFPAAETAEEREEREQLDRLLEARAALGFGENCQGPVRDMALAPDGARVAFVGSGAGGAAVRMVELAGDGAAAPVRLEEVPDAPPRRLAWTAPGELVLWQPSSEADRAVSPSIFAPGRSEVVWTDDRSLPAAIDRGTPASSRRTSPRRPLDPADLRDEADTRWQGRSFTLVRDVDPASGLPRDSVRVTHPDGSRHRVELPGEACGGPRFGRPHYRIDASARAGLDLRFVDGGCHLVRVDLESGHWARLDREDAPAVCRARRRLPPSQLAAALRGWTRDLRQALARAGADPDASFALEIDASGSTRALARSFSGAPLTLTGPAFPVSTPLRRIDVTNVAPATREGRGAPAPPTQAIEPL